MNKLLMKGGLCLAVLTVGIGQPAQAAMGCWDRNNAAAAKIRDLQSRLMVATLRCQAIGIDVLSAYNAFVSTNRSTIQAANGAIKAQFAAGYGSAAERQYDSFATALANRYGGDQTNAEICQETATVAQQAVATGGDISRLLEIAERVGVEPQLPGGECPISFASVAASVTASGAGE
jgi:hypothetical protein